MTANPKGGRFERQLLDWLRDRKVWAVRVHDGGSRDEGDLSMMVTLKPDPRWHDQQTASICVQAKNYRSLADAINNGLAGLPDQVANSGARVGCVIARRHGKPDPGDAVIVFRLGDFVEVWG